MEFSLEAWTALAPTLSSKSDWQNWLAQDQLITEQKVNADLKHIPMMLRRRFNTLGKCAMGAITQLCVDDQNIASVFSSQHGDTKVTLSLLESIGKQEDMSPTAFSLAVHNAISGLYSIVTKNTGSVTAIAAMQGHIASALFESLGQLQSSERVLCVLYDTPLPEVYSKYRESNAFPYAIAMILSRSKGEGMSFQYCETTLENENIKPKDDLRQFLAFLLGSNKLYSCNINGSKWILKKTESDVS